jgi:hypothetical protein
VHVTNATSIIIWCILYGLIRNLKTKINFKSANLQNRQGCINNSDYNVEEEMNHFGFNNKDASITVIAMWKKK